jgi:chemotaxis protein histidine kinase CheA
VVISAVGGAEVEHVDALDALDVDLFPIFEEEALELLPQLGGALRQWMARPDNLGARNEVLRVLHTVKGSGRLAGAMQLGEMTHRMESAIEQMGTEVLSAAQLEPLLARFDAMQANFDQLRSMPEQALSLPELSPGFKRRQFLSRSARRCLQVSKRQKRWHPTHRHLSPGQRRARARSKRYACGHSYLTVSSIKRARS